MTDRKMRWIGTGVRVVMFGIIVLDFLAHYQNLMMLPQTFSGTVEGLGMVIVGSMCFGAFLTVVLIFALVMVTRDDGGLELTD